MAPDPPHLEPIEYIDVQVAGKHVGWLVPPQERARWGNYVRATPPAATVTPDTRPLQELIHKLGDWVDVSGPLEVSLRDRYEENPSKVSRLVFYIIEQAEKGLLRSPAGLLVTKLRDMRD